MNNRMLFAVLLLAACGQGVQTVDANDPLVLDVEATAGVAALTSESVQQLRERYIDSGPTTIRVRGSDGSIKLEVSGSDFNAAYAKLREESVSEMRAARKSFAEVDWQAEFQQMTREEQREALAGLAELRDGLRRAFEQVDDRRQATKEVKR